jgi:hypothetical protein
MASQRDQRLKGYARCKCHGQRRARLHHFGPALACEARLRDGSPCGVPWDQRNAAPCRGRAPGEDLEAA